MLVKKTINNDIYNDYANGWWDKDSFLNVLETGIQPLRSSYTQQCIQSNKTSSLRCLDIGCGGGIITENLASFSQDVTGVDISAASLETAKQHAQEQGLKINYQQAPAENLPFTDDSFDLITCCDVLEHVDDLAKSIAEISRVLRPGGVFVYDTVNRTLMSYLSLIAVAQDIPWTRFAPKNSHVWHKFIRPQELAALLSDNQLKQQEEVGMAPSVNPLMMLWYIFQVKNNKIDFATFGNTIQFKRSRSKAISYLGHCIKV